MKTRFCHTLRLLTLVLVLIASGMLLTPRNALAARPVVTGPTIGIGGPNVCETPSVPRGVPIPYPNIGNSSTGASSGKKTTLKIKTTSDDACATDDDGGDDDSDTDDNSDD